MTTIPKPGFWNLLPVQSLDWRLSVQQEFSGLAGGDVLRADVGASLWTADVGLAPMTPATAATIEDLLRQLSDIDSKVRTLVVTPRPEAAQSWGAASAVLLQPFNTYQLVKTVRSVLDA